MTEVSILLYLPEGLHFISFTWKTDDSWLSSFHGHSSPDQQRAPLSPLAFQSDRQTEWVKATCPLTSSRSCFYWRSAVSKVISHVLQEILGIKTTRFEARVSKRNPKGAPVQLLGPGEDNGTNPIVVTTPNPSNLIRCSPI